MQIDTSVLIGRKCAEFADKLGRVLLRSRPAGEEAAQRLNTVADMTCCGLNALHAASKAEVVEDFADSYDRACAHLEGAESAARYAEQPAIAQSAETTA